MKVSKTAKLAALIFLLALAPRVIFWAEWNRAGLLSLPVVDAHTYDQEARGLLEGGWPPEEPFWQAPLYSYFLAGVYRVAGVSWPAARLVNALLGAGTCLLAWCLARHLLSRKQAWIVFGICALYGPLLYFEGQLLRESLAAFLLTGWVLVQLKALSTAEKGGSPSVLWWLGAGMLLGLTALCRENALILAPLAVLWGFFIRNGGGRWLRPVLFMLGICVIVSPVTLYNLKQDNALIPISSGGGINFYLGNNADSRGVIAIRPGRFWSELTDRPRLESGAVTAGEKSAYFYREAFDWIIHHPADFVRNTMYKTAGFLSPHEIKRNQEIYEAREGSRLLRVLMWKAGPFGFPFGLLGPAALLGLWRAFRRRLTPRNPKGFYFLAAATLLFSIGVILFFPSARYRVVLTPVLAVLAVAGWTGFARAWKESAIVLVASLLVVNAGWVRSQEDPADQSFLRAYALVEAGRTEEALSELRLATKINPKHGEAWTTMAALYGMTGRPRESMGAAYAAIAIDSTNAQAWVNLGTTLMDMGDLQNAERKLSRAIQLAPHLADAWNNLGTCLIQQGRRQEALQAFDQALRIDPGHRCAAENRRRPR